MDQLKRNRRDETALPRELQLPAKLVELCCRSGTILPSHYQIEEQLQFCWLLGSGNTWRVAELTSISVTRAVRVRNAQISRLVLHFREMLG
jgi:hypothetical protein